MDSQIIDERFRRAAKALLCVAVEMQTEAGPSHFFTFSGFLVEIEGAWAWITSDHCFDADECGLDSIEGNSHCVVTLKPINDNPHEPIFFNYTSERRVRMVQIAKRLRRQLDRNNPDHAKFRRIASNLDIGVMFIEPLYIGNLKYFGVEPFSGEEIFEMEARALEDFEDNALMTFAGIPSNSEVKNEADNSSTKTWKFLSVKPKPDSYNPPLIEFLPNWSDEDHVGSGEARLPEPAQTESASPRFEMNLRKQRTLHEVDGFVIEVCPSGDDGSFSASTIEDAHSVSVLLGPGDEVRSMTSIRGIADKDQLKPIQRASQEAIAAMTEAIRQRRSGEVVPEDLPPEWLDE